MTAATDRTSEDYQALGWLPAALHLRHPGFLASEAARAATYGAGPALHRWAVEAGEVDG